MKGVLERKLALHDTFHQYLAPLKYGWVKRDHPSIAVAQQF
jgi:hypothetical protein